MMNYWLVRAKWGVENKKADFINNDEWINGYADKYLEIVKRVETEDILLLAEDSTITHYGKCIDNPKDGRHLTVDKWELLQEYIYFPAKGAYIKTIVKINDNQLINEANTAIENTILSKDIKIKSIEIENFTVFKNKHTLHFSNGLNVIVGENGTGKTHLIKLLYSLLISLNYVVNEDAGYYYENKMLIEQAISEAFDIKLSNIFKSDNLDNLITYNKTQGLIDIDYYSYSIPIRLNHSSVHFEHIVINEELSINISEKSSILIPAKEILSFYEGFIPLYENRETSFDETYYNLAKSLGLLNLKNIESYPTEYKLLCKLEEILEGKIVLEHGRFYLVSHEDNRKTEIALIAEGLRKIGMIAQLLANGSLTKNSILFWDEPETNLNPKLMRPVVETLIELQRMGAQIFVTTHDYVILKEFDLQCNETDKIMFHSLFRNSETGEIECHSTSNYADISPNAIDDTFGNIIDREIFKSMGNLGK